jgi:hypothetical protein
MSVFFIIRRCREYLGAHTNNEINVHFQRSLHLFMTSLPAVMFLFYESFGCDNLDKTGSHACSRLAKGNFAVIVNIVMGVVFFALFNFSLPDLKLEVSLNATSTLNLKTLILTQRTNPSSGFSPLLWQNPEFRCHFPFRPHGVPPVCRDGHLRISAA